MTQIPSQPSSGETANPGWFSRHPLLTAIIGAAVGAILAFVLPLLYGIIVNPPPASTVTDLMDKDVLVATSSPRDVGPLRLIYADNALVVDAGCQSPSPASTWSGLPKITDRYSSLPQFISLAHVNVHVTWIPGDSSATHATATSDTSGIALINGSQLNLKGHELWTFAKINGQWRITTFTYNLC